ncbi:MFS general substrate transporter [Lentinula aciculospora]|uniref:MFS general substrate transporter n=1 Tax=Lentinula aciculospora TaxID=153920 RepID=A0A9W9DK32_9AGAR|nr:MFS general substrate transporter [Lentinula aciculospora]
MSVVHGPKKNGVHNQSIRLEKEESLSRSIPDGRTRDEGVSAVYEAKSRLTTTPVNEYLQTEIGFGRYQWQLFVLTGLGWAADDIWLQGVAIILPQIENELKPVRVEYATMALFAGLILGASTWGVLADLIGRRLSFNITLFIAGGANTFTALAALVACLGFGVGGNLPVDGTQSPTFMAPESCPDVDVPQWFLTLLSVWWALGQLLASLIAWPLIGNFSCASATDCTKTGNMGWRYTFYALGGLTFLMWFTRYFVFNLQESPKYLLAKGRDEEAIQVLEHIARVNGKTLTLTLAQLQAVAGEDYAPGIPMSNWQIIKRSFSSFSLSHVKPLFSTRRLATNTSITIVLWGLIGLAYPLFNGFITLYLTTHVSDASSSVSTTYRNYVIISILGVPGSIIACLVVDWTKKDQSAKNISRFSIGGRKLTMAVSTALTGIFLFLFTTSTKEADVLAYSNAMYGVLYAYTPEVFPAPHRGTGDALCSAFNRMTGILAPAIKIVTTPASGVLLKLLLTGEVRPIFVAASLFLVSAVLMLLLPIEGRAVNFWTHACDHDLWAETEVLLYAAFMLDCIELY